MYFDLKPKDNRSDLYDFDEEYEKLTTSLEGRPSAAPFVIVTGLRRMGKTSLMKSALNETDSFYLRLNGKEFAGEKRIKKKGFMRHLQLKLGRIIARDKSLLSRFGDFFEGIQWVKLTEHPPWIQFEWERPSNEMDPWEIITTLDMMAGENEMNFVLAVDEAQEFRKLAGYDLPTLMSDVYDNKDHTQLLVTGSQMGVLHDFLETEGSGASLYGRASREIEVPRLSKEEAIEFLKSGFGQTEMSPDKNAIEEAVDELDGVIGWLTHLGAKAREEGKIDDSVLRVAIEEGKNLAKREFEHFLVTREAARGRYVKVLETVARLGEARWAEVRDDLNLKEKKKVPNKTVSAFLEALVDNGLLAKTPDETYAIPDPLLVKATKEGLLSTS